MDLKNIFLAITKNKTLYFGNIIIFTAIAVAIYFLPAKYISTGSFFITRNIENSTSYFTYEGFYSQQTAQSYTNTVLALLESQDILNNSLQDLHINTDEYNLRKYSKYIDAKKAGPQIITLTVKGKSEQNSTELWFALAKNLSSKFSEISSKGDNKIALVQVYDKPVVKQEYKFLPLNIVSGFLTGILASYLIMAAKEYLKISESTK